MQSTGFCTFPLVACAHYIQRMAYLLLMCSLFVPIAVMPLGRLYVEIEDLGPLSVLWEGMKWRDEGRSMRNGSDTAKGPVSHIEIDEIVFVIQSQKQPFHVTQARNLKQDILQQAEAFSQ
eukprot:g37722.t1